MPQQGPATRTASNGDPFCPRCDDARSRWRKEHMARRLLTQIGAAVAAFVLASSAYASCIPLTPAQQRARANVIFDGVALDNPTATGIQRFRVTRYLKGRGPRIVRVNTGYVRRADGSGSVTSVSIIVRRGERWRIFGQGSAWRVVQTSVCAGSRERQ
jgi:hypothetical protein